MEKPFLSFVLQIDAAMVRTISADMLERAATTFHGPVPRDTVDAYVSPLDQDLLGAALRFVRSIVNGSDRRVLAPIHLQEIVYRVLQSELCARLIDGAAEESGKNPLVVHHGVQAALRRDPAGPTPRRSAARCRCGSTAPPLRSERSPNDQPVRVGVRWLTSPA